MATKKTQKPQETPVEPQSAISTGPLVFVSHDTRDADLAEAFANLLTDASGGMLRSFRSSDRKGKTGIEFGQEWYGAIMGHLGKATDVVALLTPHSLNRPWILFEAGVATGKLGTTVLGLAIGIPLEQTQNGPFAQFQNCGDDEDSITKLVLQLIRRNPSAAPREEAVRRQVQAFLQGKNTLLKERSTTSEVSPRLDEATMAKTFEEIKILIRDLPERVQVQFTNGRRKKRLRRIHPAMLDEISHRLSLRDEKNSGLPILVIFSLVRDEYPWLYELGLDFYRAIQDGHPSEILRAQQSIRVAIEMMSHDPFFFDMMGGSEDEESFMSIRHLARDLDVLVNRSISRRRKVAKDPGDHEPSDAGKPS